MKLLISCPNCQTSYEIDESSMDQSDGHAHCSQCQTVFNALLNSQPIPEEDDIHRFNIPANNPPKKQPKDNSDHELSSLFAYDEHSEILNGPDDIGIHDSSRLLPHDLLDIDSDELPVIEPLPPLTNKTATPKYSYRATIAWTLASLLLIIVSLAQVSWYYRAQLLLNPQTRQLIESVCNKDFMACKLPPKRNPKAFKIIERQVSMHPEVKGVLSVQILFSNQADFAQPAPGFVLSLFDNQHHLIARRSFTHKDYIDGYSRKAPLLQSQQIQQASLNLEDPGQDVTGFEFDFF